jgi:hypothetical protein
MALGTRRPAGAPTGPSTPPRLIPAGQSAPTILNTPVRYPPHWIAAADADASGVATIIVDPIPNGELWEIELIRVTSDSAAVPTCAVYDGSPSADTLLDQTSLGNFDVLEGSPPWRLPAGSRLTIQWTGMAPTSRAHVRVQYRVLAAR